MRDQIISEIRKLADENGGRPPGVRAFERATGITEGTWRGLYWARWSDALAEAGFAPNKFQGKSEADLIITSLIKAARHYKRLPTIMEVRMYRRRHDDFPNEKTIWRYFGSKDKLVAATREWVKTHDGYGDIAELLSQEDEVSTSMTAVPKEGLVYLIKSGAHYKIGRSDELERRVKEIRVALPEAASLVHTIRTDDPSGIEAYWHNRFTDRRANGEWFKLTRDDIAAFKRRRFQ